MKLKYILSLLVLFFCVSGCNKSEEDLSLLELSSSSFDNISSEGETLELTISCDNSWEVMWDNSWCTITPQKGSGNQKITLTVDPNINEKERTTSVTVISGKVTKTVSLKQNAASATAGEFHYSLPVIFHVFYKDKNDPYQYVRPERLAEILDIVNNVYKNKTVSLDMNLTFTLASTDPDGNKLSVTGVEYVEWPDNYPIDCNKFMNDETGKYVTYLWDPNKYINVMVYNFQDDPASGSTTLGIAHIPFSTEGNTYLEGLSATKQSYLEKKNLKFPYSVSVNSLFIDDQSTESEYTTVDVTVTLAHELGHYLGLHHTFFEPEEGETADDCKDTDYCNDTPSYNKVKYDADYLYTAEHDPDNFTFSNLVKRTNCSGTSFISYNIMDYAVSYSDRFTNDQRNRIRHVLTYSPLIPGPKKDQTKTRSTVDGPIDLPIRAIK